MCGIAGLFDARLAGKPRDLRPIVERMGASLNHQGPDDAGIWLDDTVGIAFGHRRLSIIDRLRKGHRPMVSASGRFVVTFNGEISNHGELRKATGPWERSSQKVASIESQEPSWLPK